MTTVQQQIPDEFEDIVPVAAAAVQGSPDEPDEFEGILPTALQPEAEKPTAAPTTATIADEAATQKADNGAAQPPRLHRRRTASILVEQAEKEVRELFCDKLARKLLQSNSSRAIGAIVAWQCMFTAWYHFHNKFTWPQAFYYSAQAGFSIGFGALTEMCEGGICSDDTDGDGLPDNVLSKGARDVSYGMTVVNILLGSSVIGGALSFFTAWVLEHKDGWEDDARETAEVKQKAKLLGIDPLAVQRKVKNKLQSVQNWKVYAFLGLSITSGILFGMLHEEWTFMQSLYFSIASMSTAGLQSVEDPTSNGTMWFAGIFIYISVPTYAMALGMFAGALTKHMEQAKTVDMMLQRITASDFQCASRKHNGDDRLQFSEYLEMQLLRTGTADQHFIDRCRAQFERTDISGDGSITIDEMIADNSFSMFDVDDDGKLTFKEFSDCVKALRAQHENMNGPALLHDWTAAELQQEFDAANTDRCEAEEQEGQEATKEAEEETISRKEFLNWMRASGLLEEGAETGNVNRVVAVQP
jgi:hypothetical protein